MKRLFFAIALSAAMVQGLAAQEMTDAQKAAADAAKAISAAPEAAKPVEKPKYWESSLKTNIKFGQTSLTNWAAGGDNTITLAAFVDGNANYKKDRIFWNNRLQLDYGFVYASSKPLLQKSDDRIYLESKFGYKNESWKNFFFSANFDFKSQFSTGYEYLTPSVPQDKFPGKELNDLSFKDQVSLWKDARKLKSNFLAPAYTNLALGIDVKPLKWLSFNIAPLTGGVVIVTDKELRKNYGMELREEYKSSEGLTGEALDAFNAALASGLAYRTARFEFGAQLKADVAVKINDNFAYTSQLVLFGDYLSGFDSYRINWDNRFDWKLAKYFSLTLTTNMIYDSQVMIPGKKNPDVLKPRLQFKESLLFGFTYTIATKK